MNDCMIQSRKEIIMKRLFGLSCVIAIMIAAIALPASAMPDTRTFEYEFLDDYIYNVGDSAGYVYFCYLTSFLGAPDTASTYEYVPTGGTGRVFAFITRQYREDLEAYSAQDDSISNNVLTCDTSLVNHLQATKTNHIAVRNYNGTSKAWDYSYVSPYHGYGVDYDNMSNSEISSLEADRR